jgi:hypothetical protein
LRPSFTSAPIGEALSDNAGNARGHAVEVAYGAHVVAIIEFEHVAVKVRFLDVMVDANDSALHGAEKALCHVDMDV